MDLTRLPTSRHAGRTAAIHRRHQRLTLERLSASLDRERRFLADAAHELRTPAAALSAYADLTLRSDSESRRAAERWNNFAFQCGVTSY